MKGEKIQTIYNPKNKEEWILIETNKNFYSMRLGGFKVEKDIDVSNYTAIHIPFNIDAVGEVYTDEEWVYIVLVNESIIASGFTEMEPSGNIELGIKFTNTLEYEPFFFESPFLYKLIVDVDGWSSKKSK